MCSDTRAGAMPPSPVMVCKGRLRSGTVNARQLSLGIYIDPTSSEADPDPVPCLAVFQLPTLLLLFENDEVTSINTSVTSSNTVQATFFENFLRWTISRAQSRSQRGWPTSFSSPQPPTPDHNHPIFVGQRWKSGNFDPLRSTQSQGRREPKGRS
jgi:hypothetical protein